MNVVSAITGLPYVGKTTLFNLLTGAHAATGGFAGAEAETNVGVAKVPDERVDRLAPLFQPKKTTHAEITYRDLGLAKPAAPGQAISAQKLGDLRTADALVHVVRAFADAAVPHVEGTVDPGRDRRAPAGRGRRLPARPRPRRAGARPAHPRDLRAPRANLLLHCRARRGPCLDDPRGDARPAGGRRDPL